MGHVIKMNQSGLRGLVSSIGIEYRKGIDTFEPGRSAVAWVLGPNKGNKTVYSNNNALMLTTFLHG